MRAPGARNRKNIRNIWNYRSRRTRDDSQKIDARPIRSPKSDFSMKRFQWWRYAATGIAGFGLVFPTAAIAAQPAATPIAAHPAAAPPIADVTLGKGGSLSGQVVDAQGAPLAQTTVTVRSAGTDVATTVTDAQGNFSVAGLKGGVVETNAAGSSSVLRAWTADASPPSSNKSVVTVACRPVVRGQSPGGPSYPWPTSKLGVCLPRCQSPAPGPICRPPLPCRPPCS